MQSVGLLVRFSMLVVVLALQKHIVITVVHEHISSWW